ncbi:hypothetical protein FB451DRAFT_1369249 [Mycena latifolia]|nr:hypothetical protein FB451DRAFT_1369249 [Mycena latifolia]
MTTTSFSAEYGQDLQEASRASVLVQARRIYLRSRLAELDASIAALSAERQSLQTESDSIIYPVLSLPPEIIAEVFRRCGSSSGPPSPSPAEAPLLLGQICRQWRQIAINTPALWRSLRFFGDVSSVELLKLWLSRTGNLPLECTVYCTSQPQADSLVEATMQHSDQWQDMSFGLPLVSLPKLHMPHGHGLLPILRTISLENHAWSTDEEARGPDYHRRCPGAPRGAHIYTAGEMELVQCLALLRDCPDLVHLSVDTTGAADTTVAPLTLHHMESFASNLEDTYLLQHLTLPGLRRLTVTRPHIAFEHATDLQFFVRRSACALEFLSVPVCGVAADALRLWVRAAPDSVTAVQLTWPASRSWSGDILAILEEADVLPRLRSLHLRGGRLSTTAYDVLLRMLLAQRTAVSGRAVILDSVTLDLTMLSPRHTTMPAAAIIAQLRGLAAEGMDIKFTIDNRTAGQESLDEHECKLGADDNLPGQGWLGYLYLAMQKVSARVKSSSEIVVMSPMGE